jgi:hypothetical protein
MAVSALNFRVTICGQMPPRPARERATGAACGARQPYIMMEAALMWLLLLMMMVMMIPMLI